MIREFQLYASPYTSLGYTGFIYILDISNSSSITFELVTLVLALEATEPVSELVTQMAVELINNHLISVQQKRSE